MSGGLLTDWVNSARVREQAGKPCVGSAAVVTSAIMRGALAAIVWSSTARSPGDGCQLALRRAPRGPVRRLLRRAVVWSKVRRMPLITVYTSAQGPAEERAQALLRDLSTAVGAALGKPERYMMAYLVPKTNMIFGGSPEPACCVEIRSIGGLTKESMGQLTQAVCKLVHQGLGVPPARTYLVCDDVPAHLWGWDGHTFG